MSILKKITQLFKKDDPITQPNFLFPGLVTVERFAAFKPNQRMQAVMIVGDAADINFYDFLKWCVENDPDLGVRLAALKRLTNFPDQTDLLPFLLRLDQLNEKRALEPYLSMALLRMGHITAAEMNNRIDNA